MEIVDIEEPLVKSKKADKIGSDVPFTNTTQTQILVRVRHAIREIYTSTNDEAL